ncbi:MAG: selenide, water dikinase SelD [Gammaproteobacteria bacterium]
MTQIDVSTVKMTEYSHGSGCGCKIAPAMLEDVLRTTLTFAPDPRLLVGNDSRDDAAVYDLGDGRSMISTTDFFMPIVDDPEEFGRIAATNAISDVYAMGGTPAMAIAIFGWPIDKLPPEVGARVVDGGRKACADAGIPLAGGHSIDAPEPMFGLAVTGLVDNAQLKRNDQARAGCLLFLTKPIGIGILTTAQKKKILEPEDQRTAPETMCIMNSIGARLAPLEGVTAMTDVTGFGLLGHLREMCEGSGVRARVDYAAVPKLPRVEHYRDLGCSPGGATRNWSSYGHVVGPVEEPERQILCDPQTSGGLLVAVAPDSVAGFLAVTRDAGLNLSPIGELLPAGDGPLITIA